jgi:uncharacterized lipoprotein YddW (UPF0748 family)
MQDAAAWLREGVIDRAMPMIYTEKDEQLTSDFRAWVEATGGAANGGELRSGGVTAGLGTYKHAPDAADDQVKLAASLGSRGVAIFAYAAMFESADPTQDKSPAMVSERAERLASVKGVVAELRGTSVKTAP